MFSEEKIKAITSIPISARGREDRLTWHLTNNGLYSVKSGYHHQKQLEAEELGENSQKWLEIGMWKRLWSMKVAPTVKHFIWRACKEALPTLANLKSIITEDSKCPICKLEPETSGHALWVCTTAKDVWNQGCIKTQKMSFQNDLFLNVWSKLNQKLDKYELEECAVMMRGIWSRRDDLMHGKGFKHPNNIIQGAKADVLSYKDANGSQRDHQQHDHQKVLSWKKQLEEHTRSTGM
ncbi:uncharacterized protein LOC122301687 [Carya illinoinensis]|uniref:uncharacterized protein LOC122301687 n=1 Tax=Carya illinoinensis TaxID=32201 RepID=UPI001C71C10B|nr:uncharacterized protein LOC122301687 [Carya illinoinensis]